MSGQGPQHGCGVREERFLQACKESKEPTSLGDAETKTVQPLDVVLKELINSRLNGVKKVNYNIFKSQVINRKGNVDG